MPHNLTKSSSHTSRWAVLCNDGFGYRFYGEVMAPSAPAARSAARREWPGDWRLEDFRVSRIRDLEVAA